MSASADESGTLPCRSSLFSFADIVSFPGQTGARCHPA
jgi:hypothetical protein